MQSGPVAWYPTPTYIDVRLRPHLVAPVPFILLPAHPVHSCIPMVEAASSEPAPASNGEEAPPAPHFSPPAPPTLVAVDTNSLSCQWKPLEQHNPEHSELPTWPVAYVLEMQLVEPADGHAVQASALQVCQCIARCTPLPGTGCQSWKASRGQQPSGRRAHFRSEQVEGPLPGQGRGYLCSGTAQPSKLHAEQHLHFRPCVAHAPTRDMPYVSLSGHIQVPDLRPGRKYAFRVKCTPSSPEEGAAPVSALYSGAAAFSTPATSPSKPQPPDLSKRERSALTVSPTCRVPVSQHQ